MRHFDHHCPVVGNCVGAGNQSLFVGYVILLLVANALFLYLVRPWPGRLGACCTPAAAGGCSACEDSALHYAELQLQTEQTQCLQLQALNMGAVCKLS